MKRILFLLTATLASFSIQAQSLAHVDYAGVLETMPERDSLEQVILQITNEWQTELTSKKAEYDQKVQDFLENQNSLPSTILEMRQNEILGLEQSLTTLQQTAERDVQNQQYSIYQPMLDRFEVAIEKVAKAQGVEYVIDSSSGVLMYAGGLDLTPVVKAELGCVEATPTDG